MLNDFTEIRNSLREKITNTPVCDQTHVVYRDDYALAINCFLEYLSKFDTIESIYQIGSIGVPGLSDIDLLIIFKDIHRDISYRYSIKTLPQNMQYIFSHDGWFIDRQIFMDIPYWFPYFDLNHIYGTKMEPDESQKEDKNLKCILLSNYLITKVPSDFIMYSYLEGYFYERIMLNMINSLQHSISLWADINPHGYRIEYHDFVEEYRNFRSQWFELQESTKLELLREYAIEAILLGYRLIEDMGDYLNSHWFENLEFLPEMSFKTKNKTLIFKREFNLDETLFNLVKSDGQPLMQYPLSFGCFLHQYTSSDGIIGHHISRCLSGNENFTYKPPSNIQSIFNCHVNSIEYYSWFSSKKFRTPANSYNTYWAPHRLSKMHRFIDRVNNRVLRFIKQKAYLP